MRSSLISLFIVFFSLLPRRAGADNGSVVVVGKADAHARTVAGDAVSAAVAKADWKLLGKQLSEPEVSSITRCFARNEPQRCILRLVGDKGVQSVAYVSVDPDAGSGVRDLKLTGRVITPKLDLVLIASRFCGHCTDDTLVRSATELMKDLLDRVALTTGRTVLSLRSSPEGARYTVDGSFVGVTNTSIDVTPGPHTVIVELEGFDTVTQNVSATEGKTAEVNAVFRRPGPDLHAPPPPSTTTTSGPIVVENRGDNPVADRRQRSRAASPLLIGGGLAIATGVVLLFFDQDQPTSARGMVQPATYYETTTPALITIASGAVLAGLGSYLYWKTPGANATASIRPTATGTVLTLSASF